MTPNFSAENDELDDDDPGDRAVRMLRAILAGGSFADSGFPAGWEQLWNQIASEVEVLGDKNMVADVPSDFEV